LEKAAAAVWIMWPYCIRRRISSLKILLQNY